MLSLVTVAQLLSVFYANLLVCGFADVDTYG